MTLAEKAAAEAVAEAPAAVAAADDVKAAQAGGRVGGRAGRKAGGLAEGLPPVVSAGDPHAYAQVAAARALPPFIPLGLSRGDAPTDTTRPSWSRPEVFCDPSGGPQEATLLPVGALWRRLFGPANPVPLWIGYTPGSVFAVSRTACLAKRPRSEPSRAPSKLYERAAHAFGLNQRREPVAELALERLGATSSFQVMPLSPHPPRSLSGVWSLHSASDSKRFLFVLIELILGLSHICAILFKVKRVDVTDV